MKANKQAMGIDSFRDGKEKKKREKARFLGYNKSIG
jgi:hypothetical protein